MKKIPFSQFALAKYKKTYEIPAGSIVEAAPPGVKLLSIYAPSLTGTGVLVFTGRNNIPQILNGNFVTSVYGIGAQGSASLLIYRDGDIIYVKNNSSTSINITIELHNI